MITGVAMIVLSLLLFNHPELLAYFIAGLFMLAGAALIGFGWNMRKRVTYQRIDETHSARDQDDLP